MYQKKRGAAQNGWRSHSGSMYTAAVAGCMGCLERRTGGNEGTGGAEPARRADAAVQCYALEGAYPQSLSYLEENYGVQVNHSRFIVSYEAYASNQLPAVAVLEKADGMTVLGAG